MHSSSNSVSSPKPSSRVGHSLYSRSFYQKQKGFTLLELVLVMLIIGLVASTPLVFIDNQDNQFRYNETLDKMTLIERAVLQQNIYRNQPILSGFVVDNGVLPPASGTATQDASELFPLIKKDGAWNIDSSNDWESWGMKTPHVKVSGGSPIVLASHQQLKGYRGSYLSDGLDSSGEFLDSWGLGFEVSNAADEYSFNYKGDDGAHPAPYDVPVSGAIAALDWRVPLNQIDIQLTNNTGETQIVAVAVFQNKAVADDEDRWTTYYFPVLDTATENSLSFTTSQWQKDGASVGSPGSVYIPAGQHAVFVIDSSNNVTTYDRLLVIPRSTQPALQFEVN
tara:strand:- start:4138 stop:5148 length:1011 start_codon:yes stop_codon:yes gene_type:complete